MSTLTNVNFDEHRVSSYVEESRRLYNEVAKVSSEPIPALLHDFPSDDNKRVEIARTTGVRARKLQFNDADCFGLRECALNGLTGSVAYWKHAEHNRKGNSTIYTEEDRDAVFKNFYAIFSQLRDFKQDLPYYLDVAMKVGENNVTVLSLLDQSHSNAFGVPTPTNVSSVPVKGKVSFQHISSIVGSISTCTSILFSLLGYYY